MTALNVMVTFRPLGYTWHVKKAHFALQGKGTMPSNTRREGASSEHVGASDLRQGPPWVSKQLSPGLPS